MSIFFHRTNKAQPTTKSHSRADSGIRLGFQVIETTGFPQDLMPAEQPASIVFTSHTKDGETSTVEVLALSNLLHRPSEDEG